MSGDSEFRLLADDEETEDDVLLAAAEAVLDNPRNMQQHRRTPWLADAVYRKALQDRPRDWRTLFIAARFSQQPVCWAALIDHAHATNQSDRLIHLFMRLRKPWCGDPEQFGIQFRRLAARLSPRAARDLIRICNPRRRLWFRGLVDMDVLWSVVVCGFLERREFRRAYDAVLQAGRGFLVRRDDPRYLAFLPRIRAFYTDVKDWRQSDALAWRTFGRASDLAPLVSLVWEAHKRHGLLLQQSELDLRGKGSVTVTVIGQGGEPVMRSQVKVPFAGLICRFADNPSRKRLLYDKFAMAPELKDAHLSEIGGMLQELVIHYETQPLVAMRTPEQKRPRPSRSIFRPLAKCPG